MRPPGSPRTGVLAGSNTQEPRGSAPRERDHRGGDHPVPSRTRQLSPPSPIVLQRKAAGGQGVALAEGAFLFARGAGVEPAARRARVERGPRGDRPLRASPRFGGFCNQVAARAPSFDGPTQSAVSGNMHADAQTRSPRACRGTSPCGPFLRLVIPAPCAVTSFFRVVSVFYLVMVSLDSLFSKRISGYGVRLCLLCLLMHSRRGSALSVCRMGRSSGFLRGPLLVAAAILFDDAVGAVLPEYPARPPRMHGRAGRPRMP